ncbi:MAG: hypothetical protein IPM42_19025 [Saprospiraceae bacterium]|nr:hypothetical protein [Saprospiraceae bacterium]
MTKLTQISAILSVKDKKKFRELITTSLFGGKPKHLAMFDLVCKCMSLEKVSVEDRLIQSDLYKMIEKYIVMQKALSDDMYRGQTLLEIFRLQENQKLFDSYLNRVSENSSQSPDTGYGALLAYEKWKFDLLKSRFTNVEIGTIVDLNDRSLILQKLKQSVNLASQSTLITKDQNFGLLPFILNFIEEQELDKYDDIGLYYYCWMMMNYSDEKHWFEKFDALYRRVSDSIQEEEKSTLYFQGINFCIRRYNKGEKDYGHILMNYYIEGLDKGYLLVNGWLSRNTYRNICTIAIRLQRVEEANKITIAYKDLIRPDERESAYHFNLANISFSEKNYNEAIISMQKVNFDDHLSNLFAKTLLLKIYYESGQIRLLDSHLDAMQVYLQRQKIVGYHKINYDKMIKYTKKILKQNPYDKESKEKLISEISQESSVTDKEWLLKQASVI